MARQKNQNETEEQASALDAMAQVLQGGDFVEGMDNYDPSAPIPKSQIVSQEQTAKAIANALGGRLLAENATVGVGISSASIIAHADKDRFKQMLSALDTQDNNFDSPGAHYNHQGYAIHMPGAVRDIPNKLYMTVNNKGILFRKGLSPNDKAYKLLDALYGDECTRIREFACRRGFGQNPLVCVSQELWHHTQTGIELDYRGYNESIQGEPFDSDIDDHPNSPFIQGLRECAEAKCIKDLSQVARYNNMSIIAVIRCIMKNACDKAGVPKDLGKVKEAAVA